MSAISQEEAIGLEPLDFYKDANDPRANSETTLHDLIDAIRSNEFADHVAEVRRLYAYMEEATNATERKERKDIADACKKQLPAVSLSGTVTGRRKAAVAENRFKHSGYLQIDLDGKDNIGWTVEEMRAVLKADPRIGAGLVSPSGKGVKGVARIRADVATHDACFMAAQAHFKSLNLTIDSSCKDPVRLCFVSHDPDAWINMDGTEMFVPAEQPEVLELGEGKDIAPKERGTRENRTQSPEKHASGGLVIRGGVSERDWTLADLAEMIEVIPRPDYADWLAICSGAWNHFGSAATSVLAARWPDEAAGEYDAKFKAKTADHTIGTVIHHAQEHGWVSKAIAAFEKAGEVPPGVFPVPVGGISLTESAAIIFPALAKTGRLYLRGGALTEINEEIKFTTVDKERLQNILENSGHTVKRREMRTGDDRKGEVAWRKGVFPAGMCASIMQSDHARKHLPEIKSLSTCAILAKGGTVLGPGYHAHGGGVFVTAAQLPHSMPFEASRDALWSLLADFDFTTKADKSRALASLVSPALKMGGWIKDDFPLDVAEANLSQSGKTYRQLIVQRIYGETVVKGLTQKNGGVGSLDERVSEALLAGRPFIMFDNFRGKLDSPILESAIRGAGVVGCRVPHRSEVNVDCAPFLWQLSTNGAELTRDLANRSIITRIRKQPRSYRFKKYPEGSLTEHVTANQAFYLGCVFSIIQNWQNAGCQTTDEDRHDFRGWCQALDWIVQNLFAMPPLLDGHREEQDRFGNPGLQWLREIILATPRCRWGERLSTVDLLEIGENKGLEMPGNPHSKDEPKFRAGRILGKLFGEFESEILEIDGHLFERGMAQDYSENGRGRERPFYLIKSL